MAKEWAQGFLRNFYDNMAGDRAKNLPLYRENSHFSYNGVASSGLAAITEKLKAFSYKTIAYQVEEFEVQPVGGNGVLILASGKLNMDNENNFAFCETFLIILESESVFHIQNEIMQLI